MDNNANNKFQEFISTIGMMGELAALIRDVLIKNGFTREEAVKIVSDMISTLFTSFGNKK